MKKIDGVDQFRVILMKKVSGSEIRKDTLFYLTVRLSQSLVIV